jgi:hypothetical protein
MTKAASFYDKKYHFKEKHLYIGISRKGKDHLQATKITFSVKDTLQRSIKTKKPT